jgi:hypothetical protein
MRINEIIPYTDGTNLLTGEGEVIHIADFNCNTNKQIANDTHDIVSKIEPDSREEKFIN